MAITYNTAYETAVKQLVRGLVKGGASARAENITSTTLMTASSDTSSTQVHDTYPEFYQSGGAGDTVLTTQGGSLPNWVTDSILHNSTANTYFGVSSTGAGITGYIVQAKQIITQPLQTESFPATYIAPTVAPPQTRQLNTTLWSH